MSCHSSPHLATQRLSLLSYVDHSSTHPAGRNLTSTNYHFPTCHSHTSQTSFETLSISLNTELRLPATSSFFGSRKLSSVSEGALSVLRRSLRDEMSCIGQANLGNLFYDSDGHVFPIHVQGRHSLSYFFQKYSPVFFSRVLNSIVQLQSPRILALFNPWIGSRRLEAC